MPRRRFAIASAALLSLVALIAAPRSTAPQSLSDVVQATTSLERGDGLFGSAEVRSNSLRGLPQWNRVLGVMKGPGRAFHACATSQAGCSSPVLVKWRGLIVSAGAGFLVALLGDIMRMPGLRAKPQAEKMDLVDGEVVGLV